MPFSFDPDRTAAELVIGLGAVLVLCGLWLWHDHRIAKEATTKCENAVSSVAQVASLQEEVDRKTLEIARLEAQQVKTDDLKAIDLRPITRPVWLCSAGPLRAGKATGAPASENHRASAGAGSTVDGTREDIRPALEAFRVRYETVIEEARAALAECSTVEIVPLGTP